LVPANQNADAAEAGVPSPESSVSRGEVELLVEQRIIRDMHLAVDSQQGSIGIDDHGGVVVKAFSTFFEE
jgi:hypothetical protein